MVRAKNKKKNQRPKSVDDSALSAAKDEEGDEDKSKNSVLNGAYRHPFEYISPRLYISTDTVLEKETKEISPVIYSKAVKNPLTFFFNNEIETRKIHEKIQHYNVS